MESLVADRDRAPRHARAVLTIEPRAQTSSRTGQALAQRVVRDSEVLREH
jgi:hypothetical protein